MVAVVTSGPPHVKSGVLLASCCVRSGPPGNHRQRVDGFRVTSHNRQDVGALPPPTVSPAVQFDHKILFISCPPQNSSSSSAAWELSRGPRSSGRDRWIRCHRLGGQMM